MTTYKAISPRAQAVASGPTEGQPGDLAVPPLEQVVLSLVARLEAHASQAKIPDAYSWRPHHQSRFHDEIPDWWIFCDPCHFRAVHLLLNATSEDWRAFAKRCSSSKGERRCQCDACGTLCGYLTEEGCEEELHRYLLHHEGVLTPQDLSTVLLIHRSLGELGASPPVWGASLPMWLDWIELAERAISGETP